ncbi:MAG: ANTAR domain-containing protein [Oscillospiraceae bacterium]|nr:ANTAR domain-containing protein [Oscillospiraceae bacterium]
MNEHHALIASASEKGGKFFSEIFPGSHVDIITSRDEASSLISDYTIVIIDAPLSDEFGTSFAVSCAKLVPTILVVKKERYEQVSALVESHGVVVVAKPINTQTLRYIVKAIDISSGRLKELENKLEDIRIINRAKLVLISNLKMSEQQAHKHIEHQAMDRRVTRREVAMSILNTYDESVYTNK